MLGEPPIFQPLNTETSMIKLPSQQNDIYLEAGPSMRFSHDEWLIDQAIRESFPASDPASSSQPGSIVNERYGEAYAEMVSGPAG